MKKRATDETFDAGGQKHYRGGDSSQYAYTQRKSFFDFAFPEFSITLPDTTSWWGHGNAASRVGIDKEEYQDLYGAGYRRTLTNKLVAKLREKLSQSTSPAGTKILILDICPDPQELREILQPLQKYITNPKSINKMVLILPLAIEAHAHSLVIHIDNILTIPTVHVIFKDPYGVVNDPEKHELFCKQIRSFVQEIKPDTLVHYRSDKADLQGYCDDKRNCAPLNIYCLDKFLGYALTDADPRDYKIGILFDVLSSDRCDRVRNDAIHYAFVLRLKAAQLRSIKLEDQDLVFKQGQDNVPDQLKTNIVRKSVDVLLAKILETSEDKLISYCGGTAREKFNSLAPLEKIKLLNLISEQMVLQQSQGLINPSEFSIFIDRIIDNFRTKIDSTDISETKAFREQVKKWDDCFNVKSSLSVEDALTGVARRGLDESSKKCIKFMSEKEVLGFISKLAEFGIDKVQYKGIITELLDFIVCTWCNPYSQEFISHDKKDDIRSQILSKLLSEGANPNYCMVLPHSSSTVRLTTPSAFDNISQFGSLSLVRVLLEFYPDKLGHIFCFAVEGKNAAVVKHLRGEFIEKIEKCCQIANVEQIQKLFSHPVLVTDFVLVKWGIDKNMYTEPMIQSCLKSLLDYSCKLKQEEDRIYFPGSDNPELLAKIRCKEKEIAAIKKILEAKRVEIISLKPSATSGPKRAHDDEIDGEGSDHDQKHSRVDGTEDTTLMGADI